jgi:hypothetical protein
MPPTQEQRLLQARYTPEQLRHAASMLEALASELDADPVSASEVAQPVVTPGSGGSIRQIVVDGTFEGHPSKPSYYEALPGQYGAPRRERNDAQSNNGEMLQPWNGDNSLNGFGGELSPFPLEDAAALIHGPSFDATAPPATLMGNYDLAALPLIQSTTSNGNSWNLQDTNGFMFQNRSSDGDNSLNGFGGEVPLFRSEDAGALANGTSFDAIAPSASATLMGNYELAALPLSQYITLNDNSWISQETNGFILPDSSYEPPHVGTMLVAPSATNPSFVSQPLAGSIIPIEQFTDAPARFQFEEPSPNTTTNAALWDVVAGGPCSHIWELPKLVSYDASLWG